MTLVLRIFRYPDGHEERDAYNSGAESYGIGETTERDGIRWRADEGRSLFGQDGYDSEIIFVPDEPPQPG